MKWLLIIVFPVFTYAQTNVDTCFTKQEIQDISNTLDELYYQDSVNNVLIAQQKQLILKQEELIRLDSIQLQYKQEQIDLLKENIHLYVEREKLLRPKWYKSIVSVLKRGLLGVLGYFIDRCLVCEVLGV